jgi:hypothetical protein
MRALREWRMEGAPLGRMENGELKMDNAVAGRLPAPFLSFSIIHFPLSIRAKRALAVDIFFSM